MTFLSYVLRYMIAHRSKESCEFIRKLSITAYQFRLLGRNGPIFYELTTNDIKDSMLTSYPIRARKPGSWSIDIKPEYERKLSGLWQVIPLVWDRKKNTRLINNCYGWVFNSMWQSEPCCHVRVDVEIYNVISIK